MTLPKQERGSTQNRRLSDMPQSSTASAWSMTEMEWWAVIVAVVAFVALVAWVEAWFAAWVSDLIKDGMKKW